MKPTPATLFILAIYPHFTHAQLINKTFGAQSASVAGIATIVESGYEVFNNPGKLSANSDAKLSFYQELPFLQKSLQVSGLCYQRSDNLFSSGFGLIQSGNEYFNQQLFSLCISKRISENLFLGTALNYQQTHQFEISTLHNFFATMGLYFKVKEKWCIGSSIININRATYQIEKKEPLGSLFKLGISYQLNESFILMAENVSNPTQSNQSKLGIDYKIRAHLHLYGGWKNNPQLLSFGMGYLHNKTKLVIGSSHHRELGFTPFAELQFSFGNKL